MRVATRRGYGFRTVSEQPPARSGCELRSVHVVITHYGKDSSCRRSRFNRRRWNSSVRSCCLGGPIRCGPPHPGPGRCWRVGWCGTSTRRRTAAESRRCCRGCWRMAAALESTPVGWYLTPTLSSSRSLTGSTTRLHGSGDGIGLEAQDHEHYDKILDEDLAGLTDRIRPENVVLLHDPQTAGLVEGVRRTGARVIWRSHIGRDDANAETDRARRSSVATCIWRFRFREHAMCPPGWRRIGSG